MLELTLALGPHPCPYSLGHPHNSPAPREQQASSRKYLLSAPLSITGPAAALQLQAGGAAPLAWPKPVAVSVRVPDPDSLKTAPCQDLDRKREGAAQLGPSIAPK